MTVASETNRSGPYTGNGVTTAFDYEFRIVNRDYLKVLKANAAGNETVLTIDADYTVTNVGNSGGGQVVLTVPLSTGQTLTLLPLVPFTQEIDLENQGAYYAETVEKAFDLSVMRDQQLQEQINRAVTIPASEDPAQLDGLVHDILRLADSADEIDIVAGIAPNVTTVAGIAADVSSVAGNATNINIVADLDPGATGSLLLAAEAAADARNILDAAPYVTTRAALKALDTTKDQVAILTEQGRRGVFVWSAGNWSTLVAADTLEGVYIKANTVASAAGAWIRAHGNQPLNVLWFGALGDNVQDDQPMFAAAYALAKVIGSATTEGPCGSVWGPPGYRYKWGATLNLDVPVRLKIEGEIFYTPVAGAAIVVGATLHTARGNTQYDIDIGVMRAVNGNGAAPTGINTGGSIGIELRDVQFSHIRVEFAIAFTYAGIYANASNNVFTGQHIQDNWINFGEVAYCGVGFLAESHGAADGAFQVNEVHIQNTFGNWCNLVVGKAGDGNTNNNLFFVSAADSDTGGGNLIVWSSYNFLQFGYIIGAIDLKAGSFYNRVVHQVGNAQCPVTDNGTGNLVQNNVEGTLSQERWQSSDVAKPPINVINTDGGATVAEVIAMRRRSPTAAANDGGVAIAAYFFDDAQQEILGGRIRTDMPTVASAGTNYNMRWLFETIVGGARAVRAIIWQGLTVGASAADQGLGTVNVDTGYYKSGIKVVGAQNTGWTAGTGTALKAAWAAYAGQTHTGAYVQATVQALDDNCKNSSQRVKAIEDALRTHGLIN
ncbi:hypothetical protein [Mesorhizobium sp. M0091]|uniref:hypothetical protein n=1 Tax=Mesorhizobium sp. M0091 TaxID=2956875 RepID=UPI00333C43C8